MVRPLWLTTLAGRCVAMKFCTIVSYLLIFTNHHRLKHGVVVSFSVMTAPSGRCVVVKFCNIVSYLLIFTNHRRFKRSVVVSGRVFFCNDKTIMAYCSIW